jgi:hypothetical protein
MGVLVDDNHGAFGVESDLTVADVAEAYWRVRPVAAIARFDLPGWSYEQQVDTRCPNCEGVLHTMRKPYESAGRTYRYVAIVCPRCPATFTLADLGLKTHADLRRQRPEAGRPATVGLAKPVESAGDTSVAGIALSMWGVRPGLVTVRFSLPGWRYLRQTDMACPACRGLLHVLYRVYTQLGRSRVQAALVCPACPATYTTRELKVTRRALLGDLRAGIEASANVSASPSQAPQQPGGNGTAPPTRDRPPGPVSPGRASTAMTPTAEQKAAVDVFASGHDLALVAGAGTGKTSTLIQMAAATGKQGLYVAFNKAIADDAARRFGSNVKCRTAHSLAYEAIGHSYRERLHAQARIPAKQTAQMLGLTRDLSLDSHSIKVNHQARLVMGMIRRFCYSTDRQVMVRHLEAVNGLDEPAQEHLAKALLPYAVRAWDDVCSPTGTLRFEHDHYMKMWALKGPVLHADFIMLDEAQDTNPVLEEIFLNQQAQRVCVGDPAQQIYGWRNARDVMTGFRPSPCASPSPSGSARRSLRWPTGGFGTPSRACG